MESIRGDELVGGERSLGDLFRQLSRDLGMLVRQESELARVELNAKLASLTKGLASIGVGAVVAYAGFLYLLLAATTALGDAFDSLALGALLVGALTSIVGAVLLLRGRDRLKPSELKPTRTIESLRDDAELARSVTSSETH